MHPQGFQQFHLRAEPAHANRVDQFVLRVTIQIAVYDSAVAIEGGYRPFAAKIEASSHVLTMVMQQVITRFSA
ncbi:MAG: hypothetical protein ACJ746_01455 [Bryobacteraceae bacterium]